MKTEYLYGTIGLLAGIVIAIFLANNAVNTNNTSMMGVMGIKSNPSNMMGSSIDSHFIEQMIPHHEDAIIMAELTLTNASRQEVKELAQNIIDSQSREIDQMSNWYKDWYGKDVPKGSGVMNEHGMTQKSELHMGMMGDESDVTALENAGDFDRAFVEEMIPHHQMAVMMATMLKNGTKRPEMSKLADDIIAAQNREIDQMREWLKTW